MPDKETKQEVKQIQNSGLDDKIEPQVDIEKMIRNHVWGSMGLGLVPIPWIDFLGLTGIQLNLVRKISKTYDIPFSQDKVKNTIYSLVGGVLPISLGTPLISLVKTVPIVGQTFGAVTMPILAGASTYAIGKVFYRHFAAGGTFLTLDPEKVKEYYAEMFQEGKLVAGNLKNN